MEKTTLEGKKVLVTGAGGFIGSHLVERLVGEGARVRAFLRYTSRADRGLLRYAPASVLDAVEWVYGDLQDANAVLEACQGIEVIFHLGALIAIPYSYKHPRAVVETNILGTLNVLMAARQTGTGRIIHTSTSEVYGTAQYTPMDEKHPMQGQSPYSASKIGADRLAEAFYRAYDLPVCTVRPFNTYGPRQSARAVIPTIITQALTRAEVRLGDLTPTRDFTYVSDTVDGFVKTAQAGDEVHGQEVNLGADFEVSIGELAESIFKALGKTPRIQTDPARLRPGKSEVFRLWSDNRKAKTLLGWTPQVSLQAGLERTIAWMVDHPELYRPEEYQV